MDRKIDLDFDWDDVDDTGQNLLTAALVQAFKDFDLNGHDVGVVALAQDPVGFIYIDDEEFKRDEDDWVVTGSNPDAIAIALRSLV
jgi:hypothetical protein